MSISFIKLSDIKVTQPSVPAGTTFDVATVDVPADGTLILALSFRFNTNCTVNVLVDGVEAKVANVQPKNRSANSTPAMTVYTKVSAGSRTVSIVTNTNVTRFIVNGFTLFSENENIKSVGRYGQSSSSSLITSNSYAQSGDLTVRLATFTTGFNERTASWNFATSLGHLYSNIADESFGLTTEASADVANRDGTSIVECLWDNNNANFMMTTTFRDFEDSFGIQKTVYPPLYVNVTNLNVPEISFGNIEIHEEGLLFLDIACSIRDHSASNEFTYVKIGDYEGSIKEQFINNGLSGPVMQATVVFEDIPAGTYPVVFSIVLKNGDAVFKGFPSLYTNAEYSHSKRQLWSSRGGGFGEIDIQPDEKGLVVNSLMNNSYNLLWNLEWDNAHDDVKDNVFNFMNRNLSFFSSSTPLDGSKISSTEQWPDRLVFHYPLTSGFVNYGSMTAEDTSGKLRTATLTGFSSNQSTSEGTEFKSASNQRISWAGSHRNDGITMSAKIFLTSYKSSNSTIIGRWFASSRWGYSLFLGSGGDIHVKFRTASNVDISLNTNYKPQLNQWVHIAATFNNNSGWRIYVDGELIYINHTAGVLQQSNAPVGVGALYDNGSWIEYFNGWIADARLYDIDLPTSEIRLISDAHLTPSSLQAFNNNNTLNSNQIITFLKAINVPEPPDPPDPPGPPDPTPELNDPGHIALKAPKVKNLNEMNTHNFKMVFKNIRIENTMKDFEFLIQGINLPGVSQAGVTVSTPLNPIHFNSTNLDYEYLMVTYKLDEDLNNFRQIHQWLTALTAPQQFQQFSRYQGSERPPKYEISVDATLYSLTNVFNPNVEIVFKNIFPISLSGFNFDYRNLNSVIIGSASFRYDYYEIKVRT